MTNSTKLVLAGALIFLGILSLPAFLPARAPETSEIFSVKEKDAASPGEKISDPPPVKKSTLEVTKSAPLPVAMASASATLAEINDCIGKAGKSGTCLDTLFGEFLRTHSTKELLSLIQHYEDQDANFRYACHPVAHAVGRETFKIQKTIHDAFLACDQTCHSGCYHGAIERFLRGANASNDGEIHISDEEIIGKTTTACDMSEPLRFRFQCLHGLGHAIMFFLDYKLEKALTTCDSLPDPWSRSSCYGGVFMENVFTATPEKRDVSPTDYHYPCDKLGVQYKNDCYMMQTTRMTEMGLSINRLFEECQKAGDSRYQCMQSVGRDLSNDARVKDPKVVSQKCELVADQDRQACMRGVAYALLDNTWDGRYAFPFCAGFSSEQDISSCFSMSTQYLTGTFAKSHEVIQAECKAYLVDPSLCDTNTP